MRRPKMPIAACHVLRESISRLCVADHRNDPAILNAWLANKTPEIVAAWAVQKGNSLLLAVEGDAVLAVGSVTDAGEITLNYVAPAARFRGVSRALLKRARSPSGWSEATSVARSPAPRRRIGSISRLVIVDDGAPTGKFGTRSGYPMSKQIVGTAIVVGWAKRSEPTIDVNDSREMVGTRCAFAHPTAATTAASARLSPSCPAPSARASAAPWRGPRRRPW